MPVQVGQTRGVSDVPVFYVPPPQQQFNLAAAFWHSFLGERNQWAMPLYLARLRAMDPAAKAKALTDWYDAQTARMAKLLEGQSDQKRSEGNVTKGMIDLERTRLQVQGDLERTRYEAEAKERLAGAVLENEGDRKFFDEEVRPAIDALNEARQASGPFGDQARGALERLKLITDKKYALIAPSGPRLRAFDRQVARYMDTLKDVPGDPRDAKQQMIRQFTTEPLTPDEPLAAPGVGTLRDSVANIASAAQAMGIPVTAAFGYGGEGGTSTTTRRTTTRPVAVQEPAPEEEAPKSDDDVVDEFIGRAPAATKEAPPEEPAPSQPSQRGRTVRDLTLDDISELIGDPNAVNEVYERNQLGPIGSPLPDLIKPDAKGRQAERFFREASPQAQLDLIEGLDRAAEIGNRAKTATQFVSPAEARGTLRTGLATAKADRAALEQSNRPPIATPTARTELPETHGGEVKGPTGTAAERQRMLAGEMSLDDYLQPSRATRRERRAEQRKVGPEPPRAAPPPPLPPDFVKEQGMVGLPRSEQERLMWHREQLASGALEPDAPGDVGPGTWEMTEADATPMTVEEEILEAERKRRARGSQ